MTTLEILRAIAGARRETGSAGSAGSARSARDDARAVASAWQALSDHIDKKYRLPPREHADVRQRTLLKVWKGISGVEAESEGRAEAWLRRVHASARVEHHRTVGTRMMERALASTPKDGDLGFVDRAAAQTAVVVDDDPSARDDADARLEALLLEVLDRVSAWLENNVPLAAKRQGDYRRAQCALLANVRGLDADAIVAALGVDPPPTKAAVYKWIERGRELVVLPAIEAWDHPAAATLRAELIGARRADAGKPRQGRRGAVSRADDAASSEKRSPQDE